MLSLFLGLTIAMAPSGSVTPNTHQASTQTPDQNYTLAYKKSVEEDKPLMVVVGAPWCPACETLKKTTIANMQNSGELDGVSVALVDRDAEPELAKTLMENEKMIQQNRRRALEPTQIDRLPTRSTSPLVDQTSHRHLGSRLIRTPFRISQQGKFQTMK